MGHGALAWRRSGERVGPRAPDVVLVLGDVGEVGEVAEGADDLDGLAGREAVQRRLEFAPRGLVLVAMEADRGLANVLDDLEDRLAVRAADRIAENAAEEADVLAEG